MLKKELYKLRLLLEITLLNTQAKQLRDMCEHTAQPGQQTLHSQYLKLTCL